jgi:hypothetical protein
MLLHVGLFGWVHGVGEGQPLCACQYWLQRLQDLSSCQLTSLLYWLLVNMPLGQHASCASYGQPGNQQCCGSLMLTGFTGGFHLMQALHERGVGASCLHMHVVCVLAAVVVLAWCVAACCSARKAGDRTSAPDGPLLESCLSVRLLCTLLCHACEVFGHVSMQAL